MGGGIASKQPNPPPSKLPPGPGLATRSFTAGGETAGTGDKSRCTMTALHLYTAVTTISKEKKILRSREKKRTLTLINRAQEAYFFAPTRAQKGHFSGARAPPRLLPPPERSAHVQSFQQEARRPVQ